MESLLLVLSMVWDHWRELWEIRNKYKHKRDTLPKKKITKALELEALAHIYNKNKTYLAKDRRLLFDSVKNHLQQTHNTLADWLKINQRTLLQSASIAKKYLLHRHEINLKLLYNI